MTEEIKKPIENITINYKDGTQDKLEYYAVVGFGENTWYSVMRYPPHEESKIKMNHSLVALNNELFESINQYRQAARGIGVATIKN